jgi:hypothetical protein
MTDVVPSRCGKPNHPEGTLALQGKGGVSSSLQKFYQSHGDQFIRASGARMRLYEYEAKAILKKFSIAASQGPWLS